VSAKTPKTGYGEISRASKKDDNKTQENKKHELDCSRMIFKGI
jgi:hypothetical protein